MAEKKKATKRDSLKVKEKKTEEKKPESRPEPKDNLVETKHSVVIGGKEIKYTVTAGTIVLKEETADRDKESEGEKPKARFFFIAYSKDGVQDKAKRPLTFSFNGGPGSSTIWLHMGSYGPVRVATSSPEATAPAPYQLVANADCLLDKSDLVFVDADKTGYPDYLAWAEAHLRVGGILLAAQFAKEAPADRERVAQSLSDIEQDAKHVGRIVRGVARHAERFAFEEAGAATLPRQPAPVIDRRSRPPYRIRPWAGAIKPSNKLAMVVFPDTLGPTKAMVCPAGMRKETPFRAERPSG